jgi:hypothetical protein
MQVEMSVPTDWNCDTKSGTFVLREFERSSYATRECDSTRIEFVIPLDIERDDAGGSARPFDASSRGAHRSVWLRFAD